MNEQLVMSLEIGKQLEKARKREGVTTGEIAQRLGIDHVRPDIAIRQREKQGVKTLHLLIEHCLAVKADPKDILSKAVDKYLDRRSTPTR